MVKIYAIKNPITGLVFYVGASYRPEQRFRDHYYGGTWKKDTERAKIMRELRLQRIKPELIIHAEVEQRMAKQAEQFWINYYINLGHTISQLKTSAYPPKHSESFFWKLRLREEYRLIRLAIYEDEKALEKLATKSKINHEN